VNEPAQIIIKALSNPIRLEILAILSEAPFRADNLTYLIENSQSSVSQHLRILRRAGLVRRERTGRYVMYSIADARTGKFAHFLANLLR